MPSFNRSTKSLFLPGRFRLKLLSLALVGCALWGNVIPVQGETFNPTSGTGHSWTAPSNWSPEGVPDAIDAAAIFQATTTTTASASLTQTVQLGSFTVDLTSGSWSVTGSGKIQWNTSAPTVNPSIHLKAHATNARSLTLEAGLIDATGPGLKKGLDITGEGAARVTLNFQGDNSGFTGGFNLKSTTAQTIVFSTAQSLGNNEVRVFGSSYQLRFGNNASDTNWSFANHIAMEDGAAKVGIYSNAKSGYTTTLTGVVSGKGGVEFWSYYGGGLELTGENTYEGTTLIAGGLRLTFHDVSNFGTGDTISFARSISDPTLIYAEGNTQDLTLKADGITRRTVDLRNAQVRIDTGLNDVTFTNALSGSQADSGLIKQGEGTLRLRGANGQRALTTVEAGTLLINNTTGSGTGTGQVTINAGAVLGGTGAARPDADRSITVEAGGTLAPGDSLETNSVGILTLDLSNTTGRLVLEDDSRLAFELASGLLSDQLVIQSESAGSVSFEGTTTLHLSPLAGVTLEEGDYILFQAGGDDIYTGLTVDGEHRITGGLLIGPGLAGYQSSLWLNDGDIVLSLQAIPEPSSLAMLSAMAALIVIGRFRRRR
ncbi:MAG TPA: autotransporter-associated beta strand repeat-containing protein [Chthoniobacteraceae bacterium]|nr:autotransporter-associated beta strand repeat-containing protein [Chthoniobacteraceae bacterium]